MRKVVLTLLLPVSATLASCTQVDLCVAPCLMNPGETEDNVITVEGEACTVDPDQVLFPYKVLFVIDISGSNERSDPNDDRVRAVRDTIDTYIENLSVSFGVISFTTDPTLETPLFTRDYEALVPQVVDKLGQDLEGTNYIDTIALAREFIEDDIKKLDEGERARTRYDIQWVSDGVPNPCKSPGMVEAATEELVALRERYGLFDLTLNTVQLTYDSGDPACLPLQPADFLEPMARAGHGTFSQMSAGELNMQLNFTEIYRAFEQKKFFLVNESRAIWDDMLIPDSDADGIPDQFETDVHVLAADPEFDGCSDRVIEELSELNAGLCESTCLKELRVENSDTLSDIDEDGIPDCAEKVLGFNKYALDSDLDDVPDFIELKQGTLAMDSAPVDPDNDGVFDVEEILVGTNPRWPERGELRERLQYRYEPNYPIPSKVDGQSCFRFQVNNVRLVHTRQTISSQEGDNQICIYIMQKPGDAVSQQPVVTRACKTARYLNWGEEYHKSPGNGILSFAPSDFTYATLGE